MATSTSQTPDDYIASLPDERRDMVERIRNVVRDNLPDGFEEGMQYGMIGWYAPLERFADTYNGEPLGLAALANQKGHVSPYLNSVYGNPDTEAWFRDRYAETGKKLDMGKSCARFRRMDDVPLEVIADTIARTDVKRVRALLRTGARIVASHAVRQLLIPDSVSGSVDSRMRTAPCPG